MPFSECCSHHGEEIDVSGLRLKENVESKIRTIGFAELSALFLTKIQQQREVEIVKCQEVKETREL